MYKISIEKKRLHFKQPAGTSRGIYTTRDIWLIKLASDKIQEDWESENVLRFLILVVMLQTILMKDCWNCAQFSSRMAGLIIPHATLSVGFVWIGNSSSES